MPFAKDYWRTQPQPLEVSEVALAAYGRRLAEFYRYGRPLPWYQAAWRAISWRVHKARVWLGEKIAGRSFDEYL